MPEQVPSAYRRPVGNLLMTALGDGYIELPVDLLSHIEADEARSLLQERFRGPAPRASVNAYAIQGGGRTVLIDAGSGTSMGPTMGRLLRNLSAAGIAPASVDSVVLTHMHPDHIGGLLDPRGRAAFPSAELVLAEAEAKFWLDDGLLSRAPEEMRPYIEGARAVAAAYRGRMRVFNAGTVVPGIEAVALPGHTPGHTGFRIGTGGDQVLHWGDIAHIPDVQLPRPEVCLPFDVDQSQAEATRRQVLDMAASERLAVIGGHLHFPAFSHVMREGDGYRAIPEAWHHVI